MSIRRISGISDPFRRLLIACQRFSLGTAAVLFLAFLCPDFSNAAPVQLKHDTGGWQLLVDHKPYVVKGICYYPTKVGESPHDGNWRDWATVDDDHNGRNDMAYQSFVDKNRNNRQDPDEPTVGDVRLLQELGCNTLRIYHHSSANPRIQAIYKGIDEAELLYNHAPNKALFRDLFKTYGIRVAMGDFIGAYTGGSGAQWDPGTDYNDPVQRANMLASVEDMVKEFRHEPYILVWILGNENNYELTHTNARQFPEVYAKFVNQLSRRIHQLDPDHPVVLCNGDTQFMSAYAHFAPDIDIFGVNSYPDKPFGALWEDIAKGLNKPVLVTEFGEGKPEFVGEDIDEDYQAQRISGAWCDIERHTAGRQPPQNSLGGFVFTWLDDWWQSWDPTTHNRGQNGWDQEYMGLASQGDGSLSPFLRQLRKSYYALQSYWNGQAACPEN